MSSNINEFLKQLEKQEENVLEAATKALQNITTEIFNALLESRDVGGTPRITGWLASGWNISLDSPHSGTAGSKTNTGPSWGYQNSTYTKFMTTDLTKTKMIYINNSIPYAHKVNYENPTGHEFMEDSVDRAKGRLKRGGIIK